MNIRYFEGQVSQEIEPDNLPKYLASMKGTIWVDITEPLEQPIPSCYNFIEADQFIAILADPDENLQPKANVLRIISGAESIIKRQQQESLRQHVRGLMHIPQLTVLVRSAILNLDQATLID